MHAIVFDMDGTLLASEHLWKQAEKTVFTALGVDVKPELVKLTEQMSAPQVVSFWHRHHPWQNRSFEQVENDVVDQVASLIRESGKPLPGVMPLLHQLKQQNIPVGLATNAPARLIPVVFETLELADYFVATTSADAVINSKPAPDIYQASLHKLGVSADQAIAIEDTLTGVKSAKNAGIKTIAVPEAEKWNDARFDIADLKVANLNEVDYQTLVNLCKT